MYFSWILNLSGDFRSEPFDVERDRWLPSAWGTLQKADKFLYKLGTHRTGVTERFDSIIIWQKLAW
jgi:hypothetical protein